MDELTFEKSRILVRQLLLCFVDFNRDLPFFDKARIYHLSLKKYDKFRMADREKFTKALSYLKQKRFIKKYYKDRESFIELTDKGKELVKKCLTDQLMVIKPKVWDRRWRLVIFDIPNQKRKSRDVIRDKLEHIGFIKLQESVYVYPFECLAEINYLKNNYFLAPYIQYIVADRIETETNLIKRFLDLDVLEQKMLK